MGYRCVASFCVIRLFLFAACLCPISASAATLHAIIAADVDDPSIGVGARIDLETLHREVQGFAWCANMHLSETVLSGRDYDPYVVLNVIDSLKTDPDDVVLYYHSAHGFRTSSTTSPFPNLFFGWHTCSLSLAQIVVRIMCKPQRLSLVIADVCNNLVPETGAPQVSHQRLLKPTKRMREFCHHLFHDFEGTIIACGAQPGQYSWISSNQGSFFTKSFIQSFKECSAKDNADWKTVFTLAQKKTLTLSQTASGATPQEPYFVINLKAR